MKKIYNQQQKIWLIYVDLQYITKYDDYLLFKPYRPEFLIASKPYYNKK